MRKSARTPDDSEQRIGRWLRGPLASAGTGSATAPASATVGRSAATASAKPSASGSPTSSGKRFVEPYQYDDQQRAAINAALADNGLGDDMAREIFIGAIAYDLAVLQAPSKQLEPTPDAKPESTLVAEAVTPVPKTDAGAPTPATIPQQPPSSSTPLADAARGLAACLGQLDDAQRADLSAALKKSDPFDRTHDEAYLMAIAREAERIAEAASDIAPAPALTAPSPNAKPRGQVEAAPAIKADADRQIKAKPAARPTPDTSALAFIRHAAKVYEQCFDAAPSIKTSDPFARVLAAVAKTTGVDIPTQARVLKLALRDSSETT